MSSGVCLTIAGSDSGGEAGIQADLTAFKDFNCHGLSAITSVTAQNPKKIISLNPVSSEVLKDQLTALFSCFDIKHIKTGLLPGVELMKTVLDNIPDTAILICDPVIASTSGTKIIGNDELSFFKSTFSKRVDFLTPNFIEAEILLNKKLTSVRLDELKLYSREGVYLKGGHSDFPGTDFFYDGEKTYKLMADLCDIKSSHGTGCRLSSAFCAAMENGYTPIEAAILAKNYVYHALNNCRKTADGKWLMSSPGCIYELDDKVIAEEIK